MTENKRFKKTTKLSVFALILITAFAGYHLNKPAVASTEEVQAPPAMPVQATVITPKSIQVWKSFSASLEAVDYVQIRPQVSGAIEEIKFQDGQDVKKGDVLYVIDPRPYKAAVNQMEADVNAAKNQAELADKELIRAEELIKTDAISKRIYDERKSAASIAKANINSAYARLEQAKINYDYAFVKAPISGRISRAEIKIGNLVEAGPNAPVLTSIVSTAGIYADFEVDEQTYLNSVRLNASDSDAEKKIPVKLYLGDNAQAYDGFIDSFDNRIDPTSGTIRARAYFDNKDGHFLPGMFAKIEMGNSDQSEAIMISERAIGTDQDRKFVYVVGTDNKVAYRMVTLGDKVGENRIILSGLVAGDTVITDGLIRIRPDMVVDPQIAPTETAVDKDAPMMEEEKVEPEQQSESETQTQAQVDMEPELELVTETSAQAITE